MARQLQSYALNIIANRADGVRVNRRYANLAEDLTDDQARLIQNVVNGFDSDTPFNLRLTRVDAVDTEADD